MIFLELAEKILEKNDKPMRAKEIWEYACKKGYDSQLGSQGKTPIASLSARVYLDMKYKADTTKFVKISSGYLGLKNKSYSLAKINVVNNNTPKILEKDMHIPLNKYLVKSKIYSKTINANATKGVVSKGAMKWGTPDIVGVSFREDLHEVVREFCTETNIPTVEIYAYELKLELTLSNLTEYFFQTVSNSTWANEAWLVAFDIENEDPDLNEEIERLNQSFGVGILKLDIEDVDSSQVILPARKRNNLDLTTLNKLCANDHFKEFFANATSILKAPPVNREAIINDYIQKGIFNKVDQQG